MKAYTRPLTSIVMALSCITASYADTLQDVYELALSNDAKLKAAEANYRANIETEEQAFSQLLPQIVGTANYTKGDNDVLNRGANLTPGVPNAFYSATDVQSDSEEENYSISLQQKVFDLPTWFTFKGGKAITKQAEAQLAADQQALMVRTVEAYFNVLRARDNLEAAKAEEQATKRQLEQTQKPPTSVPNPKKWNICPRLPPAIVTTIIAEMATATAALTTSMTFFTTILKAALGA